AQPARLRLAACRRFPSPNTWLEAGPFCAPRQVPFDRHAPSLWPRISSSGLASFLLLPQREDWRSAEGPRPTAVYGQPRLPAYGGEKLQPSAPFTGGVVPWKTRNEAEDPGDSTKGVWLEDPRGRIVIPAGASGRGKPHNPCSSRRLPQAPRSSPRDG